MGKQLLLDRLFDDIAEEPLLGELRGSAINLVKGAGSLDSQILFIGEAPGKKEDELGTPFMGASGKILNDTLGVAGFSRDDVYITNIVKYRPPENRDPSKQEKAVSWPYLLREIEIIKPKIIAPLGRHSLSTVLPEAKIGEDHGRSVIVQLGGDEYTVVPLYHPAATIYNRSLRTAFVDDILALNNVLDTLN